MQKLHAFRVPHAALDLLPSLPQKATALLGHASSRISGTPQSGDLFRDLITLSHVRPIPPTLGGVWSFMACTAHFLLVLSHLPSSRGPRLVDCPGKDLLVAFQAWEGKIKPL